MMPINGKTKLCVLIGNPVEHSMSPIMHNAAFEKLGLNFRYLCLRVENENVEKAVQGLRAFNIAGANVTVPHKQAVMPFLDKIDETAQVIGAVNTIVNQNGKLIGYNTDWAGAADSLEEHIGIDKKRVVLAGAGGSARAIIYGIKKRGGNLIILNRTVEKAKKLAEEFHCEFDSLEKVTTIKADIFINSTSIGMSPNTGKSILTKDAIINFKAVFDIVYNPLETQLLLLAKENGVIAIHGLKMLVYQGAEAFRLWTGVSPDDRLMYSLAKQQLLG